MKRLKPIRLKPVPSPTILGGDNLEALKRQRGEHLIQYLGQLKLVADLAGVTVGELLENDPLLRFAEKTFGLGEVEIETTKPGRPSEWDDSRLFHLWAWVRESEASNLSESLRSYMRAHDVGGIAFSSLRQKYYDAIKSPFVAFLLAIQADDRVSDNVEMGIAAIECALLDTGNPLFVEKKL